ncbi:Lsr2 family protein [Streptomyces sp. NPDC050095]|uniref:histone-like nucleoid-structuring protein Lsr2 n=1 Tax=unclassified Streptomyces TaxID=2593676 RepID=UPI00341B7A3C
MAQKVQVLLVDDIDGGEADETVTFALDGKTYEIDLSEKNADKLRKALEPFRGSARRTGKLTQGRTRSLAPRQRPAGEPTPEELRRWAKENGHEVNERGRVPQAIKEAYANAQG